MPIKIRPDDHKEKQKLYRQSARGKNGKWKRCGIPMTHDLYIQLFNEQNGKCAICFTQQEDLKTSLAADHDHSTNKIRGLLCIQCNLMIGNAKDNIDILNSAISYLRGVSCQ